MALLPPLLYYSKWRENGKTADGAIWLDNNLLSSYDYFQYFRNIDDKDVKRFLYLFTEIDCKEIEDGLP